MKIVLKNLTKTFPNRNKKAGGDVVAVDNFSYEFPDGKLIGLLGPSGCGKSTLLRHLKKNLMPYGNLTGRVLYKDTEISDISKRECASEIGFVGQNPDNQIVATVVEEDVAFGPLNLGLSMEEVQDRVEEALARVGMSGFEKKAPHHLSGGQKKRVAIAGILAMKPEIMVLDEPTAMLDPKGRREVVETIGQLNREKGITVVLITHHMDEAAKADRVIVMEKGEVILDGKPREVFSHIDTLLQTILLIKAIINYHILR